MNRLGEWDDDTPVYDLANAPVTDMDEEPDEPLTRGGTGGSALAHVREHAFGWCLVGQRFVGAGGVT